MADKREYEDFIITLTLNHKSRLELRKAIVNTFLAEKPGYWKDGIKHVTRYKYFVETLSDGRRVYLLRPTFLNKGIDFQVWVERFDGEKDKRPSHKDVFVDMQAKLGEDAKQTRRLFEAVEEVYNCAEPSATLKACGPFRFKKGFSPELLLSVLKWLFIEQDVTYWNYDGRTMLFSAIKSNLTQV